MTGMLARLQPGEDPARAGVLVRWRYAVSHVETSQPEEAITVVAVRSEKPGEITVFYLVALLEPDGSLRPLA
jgi:hypothetical protein